MLDTRKEYEEYTVALNKNIVPRLNPGCFVSKPLKKEDLEKGKKRSDLQGLPRALTVIARHFLFDKFHYEEADTPAAQKEIISQVTHVLKAWCGFLPDGEKTDYEFEGWLEAYYQNFITKETLGEGLRTWEEIRTEKSEKFAYPIFLSDPTAVNNLKATNYERVIARAVEEGPLCTYFLTCKSDFANKVIYKTKQKDNPLSGNGKKPPIYRDWILKMIAVYLIEKDRTGNDFVIINLTDFSHWIQQKIDSQTLSVYFYEKTHLFDFTVVNGNTSKMRVHPQFLKDYDFKITADKTTALQDGYLLFEDRGAGKPLNCI